ncbi:MAG: dephospho-CoA kinase [Tannerella sp.]|jgi:dephospho-CoA kinase|nr:dephospho-CoA kinase [Tannerella sp.]
MTTTIGITGGIGSGKSLVVSLLETYGMSSYVADRESKRLTATLPAIREQLTALLGEDIYDANGLNRCRMASLIFHEPSLLAQVHAIIHPEVARHFREWVSRQSAPYAVLESAILFESGFDRQVNWRVTVYAPASLRLQRVMTRDGLTETDVLRRMKNQWTDEVKKAKSDYVVFNDGKQALIPQIERLVKSLPGLSAGVPDIFPDGNVPY